eukprot:scaffold2177_cov272-Pinguiococcus_pyrenoidosus.AAC.7
MSASPRPYVPPSQIHGAYSTDYLNRLRVSSFEVTNARSYEVVRLDEAACCLPAPQNDRSAAMDRLGMRTREA